MKLNHLALAVILASSGALLSCDDTKKPDAKKGEVAAAPTETVVEQQKMNAEELADAVEARYKNLIEINNKIYSNMLVGHKNAQWKEASATVDSYARQENGAVAKESVTFEPTETNPFIDKKVVISSDDSLTYNEALLAQGVVAQIQHQIDYSNFVTNIKSEKMRAFFEQIFANMSMNTDLLTGDNVKIQYDVKPFESTIENPDGDKGTLNLAGINGSYAYNEKDVIENPGSGETEINFSGIKITPENEKGALTIDDLSFKSSLSTSGDLSIHVTPIKFDFQSEEVSFALEVQKIEQTGTGVKFDPILGQYLGKNNGTIGDIIITEKGEEPLNIGHIDYNDDVSKDDQGNYDLGGKWTLNLNGDALQQKLQVPVQPKSLSVALDVNNLSPETIAISRHFVQVSQTADQLSEDEQEALVVDTLQKLGASLSADKTELHTHFVLSTDQGEASIEAKFLPPAGDDTAAAMNWQQAIEAAEEDPTALLMLLRSNIDFTVDIKVSKDLLAAFGVDTLVETQSMGMVENQNGTYVVHIENSSKGLFINGQQMM